jgi:hypothetical protein
MSTFGYSADDVFASKTLDAGTAGTATGSSNGSLVDRIFATGTDFVSQFLDYQAKARLAQEQNKYQLAAMQQNQMMTTTEVPQNVGQNPMPLVVTSGGGMNQNMLLLGAVALVAVLALK